MKKIFNGLALKRILQTSLSLLCFFFASTVVNAGAVTTLATFESGLDGFTLSNSYWKRDSAGTPSSSTGPNSGANGSAYYLYFETSSGSAYYSGNTATAESGNFEADEVSFYYHMYGSNIGTLSLEVYSSGQWTSVWSKSGQQHTSNSSAWTQATVSLSAYSGSLKIRYKAVAAGSWKGDIAVDQITYTSSPSSQTPDFTETGYAPKVHNPLTSDNVGLSAGQFRVDESGAATYNLPINVAPGRAGVTPQISLNYSSNNMREGPVGVSWAVGGLSMISRCPKTPIHDGGEIRQVMFDNEDPFCMDGQRLIRLSGTHGTTGATYHTEVDNFNTIKVGSGDSTSGPTYFEVTNKAGETHYYGDVTGVDTKYGVASDAFVEPGGMAAEGIARSWALKIIKDVKGNYIKFNYNENTAEGTFYIDNIEYTGNLTASDNNPFAQIDFIYQDYDKGFKGYMSGSYVNHNKVLTQINSTVDGENYRSYFLDYENSAYIEERTLLKSVQECSQANQTSCLPATQFNWQRPNLSQGLSFEHCETEPGFEEDCWDVPTSTNYSAFASNSTVAAGTENIGTSQVFDINGDGFQDLIYVSNSYWYTKLGSSSGMGAAMQLTGVGDNKKEYALNIDSSFGIQNK